MKKTRKKLEFLRNIQDVYEKDYKKLLIIPFVILILAFVQIGYQLATTVDFINKGVSLKGGITLSVQSDKAVSIDELREAVSGSFPAVDFNIRTITSTGVRAGTIIEADVDVNDQETIDGLIAVVESVYGIPLSEENLNVEAVGSVIGDQFFSDTIKAVLLAFLFMAIVVFFYFRILVPSGAVILAAFSNMVVTIAVVNMLDVSISTAGIAAFLMMIGYSVDTDILLSVRVLKKKEGTVVERVYNAMKTGLTMQITTMIVITIALIVTTSAVIGQIMLILLIGLIVDVINTWIQNAGIIRWYLEARDARKSRG